MHLYCFNVFLKTIIFFSNSIYMKENSSTFLEQHLYEIENDTTFDQCNPFL